MAKKPCRETAELFTNLPTQWAPSRPDRAKRKHSKRKSAPQEFVDDTRGGRPEISGTIRAGKRAVGGWFLRVDGRYEGYGADQGGVFATHDEARTAAYHWLRDRRDRKPRAGSPSITSEKDVST